jgi:hypothetical protein
MMEPRFVTRDQTKAAWVAPKVHLVFALRKRDNRATGTGSAGDIPIETDYAAIHLKRHISRPPMSNPLGR